VGQFKTVAEIETLIEKLRSATKIFKDNKVTGRFKDAMAESLYL
jgi:hypothetical protein